MNLLHSLLSTSRGKLGMSLLVLVALIFSGCGGGGGGSDTPPPPPPPPPPAPTLVSIAISPTATIIKKSATTSYIATGTYSDGTTANITSTVTWTSSTPGVATISAGVATGVAAGTTTVTASLGGRTSPDAALSVITLNGIAITPASAASVIAGATTSFTATGTYSNGTTENITSQVTWTLPPADAGIAAINPATGVASGIAAGTTVITATASGVAPATAPLTVIANTVTLTSIAISQAAPATPSKGVPVTFTAMGTFSVGAPSDISGSVTWKSSNTLVATINSSGIATTLGQGVTRITAESGAIVTTSGTLVTSNFIDLNVAAPKLATLAITPTPASVALGIPKQLTISGTLTDGVPATATDWGTLTWTFTPNNGVVTINGTGLATGVALGATDIYATCTASAPCSGTVNSNTVALTVALSQMGGARQGLPMTALTAAVSTLAGTGAPGHADGSGTLASFYAPGSITTDGTNLYVADTANYLIRKIVISSDAVTTLAGSAGFSGASNLPGTGASFNLPEGITTDGSNLYVADTANHLIRQIVISTAAVSTLAGSGAAGSANGTGAAATFSSPRGITVDGNGNLYVADTGNNKIRKIVITTGVVSDFVAAGLVAPRGITTDGSNLYVADTGDNTIHKIVISSGAASTLAGSGAAGSADGTGTAATFFSPRGITTDGTNLYVADTESNKIRKIVISSGAVTTLAGSGTASSVDGSGTAATFWLPHGITTDGTSLFVVDNATHKIRKIQ